MMDEQTRGANPDTRHSGTLYAGRGTVSMFTPEGLKIESEYATIHAWFRENLESEYRALKMRLNDIARLLDKNPKRCENCGHELR